ncbi:hypothetical protein NNC19_15765 [Clostridium sp. SHJSY1]|uniref:hypothetical protein n=1 Tax=Clostridium sp. SHJSY1 TaxID=2942483 RepID=UPI00287607A0|nr:hypothetical protein [Clostridium sp. SHJSY1]MDS0527148.1 hypothetical protein [Clostridium sp. SHJSY1]
MRKNLVKVLGLIMVGSCLSTLQLTSVSAKSVQTTQINSYVSMPHLANVRIASYSDANSTYSTSGGTISKGELPFSFLTTKSGYGGVRAVYIDGVDIMAKSIFEKNGGWTATEIKTTVNNDYIKGLKTGTHKVVMVCWDVQNDYTLSDSFTFNLVD